jgi:Fe-S cluster biogenesis protein NfuA
MFIQTQTTPNPTSLMFLPGQTVVEVRCAACPARPRTPPQRPPPRAPSLTALAPPARPAAPQGAGRSFSTPREAMASPLAKRLFQIDGVTSVFFGGEFVTVTKSDDYAWAVLKPDVFAAITEFYASGEPAVYDAAADPAAAAHVIHDDDDEVVAMVKELLETRIRPAVQEDGGDVAFRTFDPDTGVVTLKMMGACSGCPSSAVTLKSGIENMLMHYIPEVRGVVEAEPDEYEGEGLKAFNKLEQHLSA